ncbi:hypothetical protein HG531_005766 [Fusarium graminearum]|nr:hypothetical protein HG531_005766 [Fusarium graminearum]
MQTDLANVSDRSCERNGVALVMKVVAVKLKELEEHFAEMVFGHQTSTLNLWHKLQHTDDQANNREATDSTIHRFIETAHEKKVFDHGDEDGHSRILFLPLQESIDCVDTAKVLE